MSVEYVKLVKPEVVYSKKNLLQSQVEILTVIKAYEEFKRLRKEEFMLKIALKSKLEAVKNQIAVFESLLPKAKIKAEENVEQEKMDHQAIKKKLTLEQEIDLLKKKIASLQY